MCIGDVREFDEICLSFSSFVFLVCVLWRFACLFEVWFFETAFYSDIHLRRSTDVQKRAYIVASAE